MTAATDGREAFRALAEQSRQWFSQREQRATAWHVDGNTVRVAIAYRGLLAVDLPDGPRAGQWLHLTGESEFAFNADAIAVIIDRA